MPDPKNNAKLTGDTHLPEIEGDDFDVEGAHSQATGTEGTSRRERGPLTPRRGGRHAGVLKDTDSPSADDTAK